MAIKLVIVDDHQMFIEGLRALLKGEDEIEICAVANNGFDALNILDREEVDLMITDLSMPEMSGTELVLEVKKKYPEIKILVLSMHSNRETVSEIMMAEAEGYILKNTGRQELLEAIRKIMEGGTFFSNDVISIMLERIKREKKVQQETQPLTERELEILKLIVEEYSSEQIAEKLFISKRTVDTHRKHILKKTNSKTIVSLIKFAFRNELVQFE